jgi:hypothetical protein
MSEELENSLQHSVETYLNERLRGIDEQLARLQTEFDESLARLRESTASGQPETTTVSSAITAHLQAAREQKLSGPSVTPEPSADLSNIKRAIEEIQNQQTQADVLSALLRNAAQFADRVALFVIRGDQAIAWRACEGRDRSNLETISGVALPMTGNTVVSHAARSGSAETASGTSAEDGVLIEQFGGEPQQLAAVPLRARKKVVAVLYADSAWPHRDAIQLDAMEALARVAGMAVELVSSAQAAQPQQVTAPATAAEPAPATVESETATAPAPSPEEIWQEPSYTPQVEPRAPEAHVEEAAMVEAPAEIVAEVSEPSEPVAQEAEAALPTVEETTAPLAPPPPVEKPEETFASHYSAPLGSARRYGVSEPELPIEVGEEERRLHNDARRFARLLVSEIKLYNEQKVSEGRHQGDIYDRLREDIDRSRQMYDKRVARPVAARHDYFHQELVNTLAEGDPAKLGNSYPGAVMSAN